MEMQLYFGSGGGGSGSDVVDWFHPLAEFPAMPLCMSPPPLLTRSVESFPEVSNFLLDLDDHEPTDSSLHCFTSDGTSLPMAAAAPSHDRGSAGGYSSAIILR
jgi:hypothetical protein